MSPGEQQGSAAVLAVTAVSTLGPFLGPYVVIAIGAVWGGAIAVTTAETATRAQGWRIMLKAFLMGTAFTSAASWMLANWLPASWHASPELFLFGVATFIGWSSDKLGALRDRILNRISPEAPKS